MISHITLVILVVVRGEIDLKLFDQRVSLNSAFQPQRPYDFSFFNLATPGADSKGAPVHSK